MKETVFAVLGVLIAVFGLTWLVQGNDFFLYKVFAPKYEQVRRETFEQSKAYQHGMIQELRKQQIEYAHAKGQVERDAIASLILQQIAEMDDSVLPLDLRSFVQELRQERMSR